MTTVDLLILLVVLLSAAIGLARGLLKEVLSLASWLAAFILALFFTPQLAERIQAHVQDESARLVVSFIAIFIGTLILGGIVQWLTGKLVESTGLSGTDRFLGFLFGSARGVLVCVVVLMGLRQFAQTGEWWQNSVLVPELLAFEQDVLALFGQVREWISVVGAI